MNADRRIPKCISLFICKWLSLHNIWILLHLHTCFFQKRIICSQSDVLWFNVITQGYVCAVSNYELGRLWIPLCAFIYIETRLMPYSSCSPECVWKLYPWFCCQNWATWNKNLVISCLRDVAICLMRDNDDVLNIHVAIACMSKIESTKRRNSNIVLFCVVILNKITLLQKTNWMWNSRWIPLRIKQSIQPKGTVFAVKTQAYRSEITRLYNVCSCSACCFVPLHSSQYNAVCWWRLLVFLEIVLFVCCNYANVSH